MSREIDVYLRQRGRPVAKFRWALSTVLRLPDILRLENHAAHGTYAKAGVEKVPGVGIRRVYDLVDDPWTLSPKEVELLDPLLGWRPSPGMGTDQVP